VPRNRQSSTPEHKDEAAKIAVELSRLVASVAREPGLKGQTLHNWVESYQKTHADAELPRTLPERARLRELEKEFRELRLDKDFPGKSAAFFAREYR
jgi:transposase